MDAAHHSSNTFLGDDIRGNIVSFFLSFFLEICIEFTCGPAIDFSTARKENNKWWRVFPS